MLLVTLQKIKTHNEILFQFERHVAVADRLFKGMILYIVGTGCIRGSSVQTFVRCVVDYQLLNLYNAAQTIY